MVFNLLACKLTNLKFIYNNFEHPCIDININKKLKSLKIIVIVKSMVKLY